MKRDLPKYVYFEYNRYYTKLPGVGKVELGRDKSIALSKFYAMTSGDPDVDFTTPSRIQKLWNRHRKSAKARGLEFSISEQDVADLMMKQGNVCAVTSLPFRDIKPANLRIRPWIPSLDRKLSKAGYTKENVRIVCAFVNVAMNGFGDEFFHLVLEPLIQSRIKAEKWA